MSAVLLAVSVVLTATPHDAAPAAAAGGTIAVQIATLKDTLEKGLKARRPAEFDFVARVVELVEAGELTEKLVRGTFRWATDQDSHKPFPYFERALKIRSKKEEGVDL